MGFRSHPYRLSTRLYTLSISVAVFGFTSAAFSAAYRTNVSAIRHYAKADGSFGVWSNRFWVEVADCRSKIRAGSIWDGIDYLEYRCDGTNSSVLTKYSPKPDTANQATLTLNTGPLPKCDFLLSDVWLAYASACFYQHSTGGRTEPVFDMGSGFRENHLKVKSEWKLTTSMPPVLEYMRDFSDGYQYSETNRLLSKEGSFQTFSQRHDISKLPAPFDKEHTNATYSVLQWTNYQGLTLPSEWQIVQYKPNFKTGQLEPRLITHGYTTSFEVGGSETNFAPYMPKETYIIDSTLEAQGIPLKSYGYLSTEGRILTLTEMKEQQNFRSALLGTMMAQADPGKDVVVTFCVDPIAKTNLPLPKPPLTKP